MRNVGRYLLSVLMLGIVPAAAEDEQPRLGNEPPPSVSAPSDDSAPQPSRLDRLFGDLKRERNDKAAGRLADSIWAEWARSGSASIDLMMQWSTKATQEKKFDVALDFLDQVVTLQPAFAEGWNRRATVHFMMDNYSKAMADIDRTLRLEPRHFGALSGMGAIMKATGRKEMALQAYERALAVYPMMRQAQGEVATLSDELTGDGI